MDVRSKMVLSFFCFSVLLGGFLFAAGSKEHANNGGTAREDVTEKASDFPSTLSGRYAVSGDKGRKCSFTGMVTIYGNEPFSWTGISPDNSEMVYAVTPSEAARDLRAVQGYKIRFTGIILQGDSMLSGPGSGDGIIAILSWKIVK